MDKGEDLAQQLGQGLAFFGRRLPLAILPAPVRRMPVEQRMIPPVFFQDAGHFVLQGFDLTGHQGEHFFRGMRCKFPRNSLQAKRKVISKCRRTSFLTLQGWPV